MPRFPDEGGAFSALTEGKRRGALTECVPAAPYPERAVRRGSEPHRLRPRLAVPRTPAVPVGCVLPANARVIEQHADRATPDARLPALARSAVPRYTQGQEAEIKERIRYGLPHHERPDLSGAPCAAVEAAEAEELSQNLKDTLLAHREECVGMAANMIGVCRRAIVFDDGGKPAVMLNPEILRREGPYDAQEGCLSLPGQRRRSAGRKSKCAGRMSRCSPALRPLRAGLHRSFSMKSITATAF